MSFHCGQVDSTYARLTVEGPLTRIEVTEESTGRHFAELLTSTEAYRVATYLEWLLDTDDRPEPALVLPDRVGAYLDADFGPFGPISWVELEIADSDEDAEPVSLSLANRLAAVLARTLLTASVLTHLGQAAEDN